MGEQQNNRELGLIDILQIFGQWIVAGLKKLVEWGMFLLFFAFKQWKILAVAVLAIGIYTVVAFKSQDAQYEARMIVRSNALETTQMKSFFDNFAVLVNNDMLSEEKIKEKTGLNEVQCEDVVSVNTYFCIDNDRDGVMDEVDVAHKLKSSDDKLDSLNLCVKVVFANVDVLDEVKESLIYYLNTTPYVIKMNEARLAQQTKRRLFILNEIGMLDTIQKRAYGESEEASSLIRRGGVVVDNRRVLEIYEDKDILWERYEIIEKELNAFVDPITVVEDFVIQQRAVNTLSSMLKKNVVLGGFAIYMLLLLALYIRREKDKYISKF